jgi:hypothetical protein
MTDGRARLAPALAVLRVLVVRPTAAGIPGVTRRPATAGNRAIAAVVVPAIAN